MRHLNKGNKLRVSTAHRQALQRNILVALFTHGKIITRRAVAKQYSRSADKVITIAKRAAAKIVEIEKKLKAENKPASEIERQIEAIRVAHLRRILVLVPDKAIARKVLYDIAPLFTDRKGGYTSVFHLNKRRLKDNAQQAILMLVAAPTAEQVTQNIKERKAAYEKRSQEKNEANEKKAKEKLAKKQAAREKHAKDKAAKAKTDQAEAKLREDKAKAHQAKKDQKAKKEQK